MNVVTFSFIVEVGSSENLFRTFQKEKRLFQKDAFQVVKFLCETRMTVASPAGVFRGDRISSLPTFVGREEIRSPLKTPAGEARMTGDFSKVIIYI